MDTCGEDIASFDFLPVREGEFSRARLSDVEWLLLDSKPITVNGEGVRIRVRPPARRFGKRCGYSRCCF